MSAALRPRAILLVPLCLCAKSISPTSVRGAFFAVDTHGSATPASGQHAIIDRRSARAGRPAASRAREMGADIAANPHYPVSFRSLPACLIPVRFSCDRRPAKRRLRRGPELSGDGLVGPLSGAGRTWKALHHLFHASAETVAVQAMDCISCPDRVRLNSWESRRSVTRVSVHFLVVPARSFPAGLATCLPVPAVRRLRRPMIES